MVKIYQYNIGINALCLYSCKIKTYKQIQYKWSQISFTWTIFDVTLDVVLLKLRPYPKCESVWYRFFGVQWSISQLLTAAHWGRCLTLGRGDNKCSIKLESETSTWLFEFLMPVNHQEKKGLLYWLRWMILHNIQWRQGGQGLEHRRVSEGPLSTPMSVKKLIENCINC